MTDTFPQSLVDFENPPVIEVVCGISFKSLDRLLVPHLGRLWQKIQADYPNCREVTPLLLQIESYGPASLLEAQLLDTPPLPRIWFVDAKGNRIVQVQRDRFLYNWKKVEPEDEYPRYHQVIQAFCRLLKLFQEFVAEHELGQVEPIQYEMRYINHIPVGLGWESLREVGRVFPDFSWRTKGERWLAAPEGINWRTSFLLPDRQGRFHVQIRSTVRIPENTSLLVLDLTVRGMSPEPSEQAMNSWFETAHTWIVNGFCDLTSPELQRGVWRRKP